MFVTYRSHADLRWDTREAMARVRTATSDIGVTVARSRERLASSRESLARVTVLWHSELAVILRCCRSPSNVRHQRLRR